MNKHKKIKKILCFLLAFVVMVSTPLNLQANALAIEPWVIWAIVTYLTSVGLVFTATGGAQAVYDAVEEKVNQYGDNVIDFYDIVRSNLRIVKPPNLPPNWNPDFGNLFITAVGVEALGKFAEWLTSDGGWLAGSNVNEGHTFGTFDVKYNNGDGTYKDYVCVTSIVGDWETSALSNSYKRAPVLYPGTDFLINTSSQKLQTVTASNYSYSTIQYNPGANYQRYQIANVLNSTAQNTFYQQPAGFVWAFSLPVTAQDFLKDAQIGFVYEDEDTYLHAGAIYEGYFYYIGRINQSNLFVTTLSADIEIPTEFPEIKPLPTLEGLLLESESLAAESLEALGNVVETYFNDEGTIPAPQPNIVPDPEVVPNPTPVPTPEIEDVGELGLPTLGEAIFSKFPFSLPKDLKRISDILNAEPVTPKWEVDLYETLGDRVSFRGSTKLTIDLEEYEELGQISRWASVISFVVFLIIITKGVIRW